MTNAKPRRPRRARSVTEMLLSIVLLLEAILVFFVTLAVYGLRVVEPLPAFAGGAALVLVLLLAIGTLRFAPGVWLGWVLQVVLVATGVLLPAMYIVATIFVAMWVYCFIKGRGIDRRPSAAS